MYSPLFLNNIHFTIKFKVHDPNTWCKKLNCKSSEICVRDDGGYKCASFNNVEEGKFVFYFVKYSLVSQFYKSIVYTIKRI